MRKVKEIYRVSRRKVIGDPKILLTLVRACFNFLERADVIAVVTVPVTRQQFCLLNTFIKLAGISHFVETVMTEQLFPFR